MIKHRDKLILLLLVGLLFGIQVFVAHNYLTSIVPGANDFYSRWAGARALLIDGRDPYGLDVTWEIQEVIAIDHSEVGRGGFAYPLHVIFLFLPLVWMSYAWTQAVWWVMLLWMAIGTAIILLFVNRRVLAIGVFLGAILFVLTFYPITRSIFLGQFTIPVLFFLSGSLLLLQKDRPAAAGALLALTSIKPQMVLFIAPLMLLWVVSRKEWRFLYGFFGAGGLLFVSSLLLFPRWPLSFIEDVQRYRVVAGGRNPLTLTLDWLWPGQPDMLFYVIALPLLAIMLWFWWKAWGRPEDAFKRALHWTIVVSLLVTFQTGTTNYVLLLIPIFAWLALAADRWGRWAAAPALVLNVSLWLIFLNTVNGNAENLFLFLPLPWLSLLVLALLELAQARQPSVRIPLQPDDAV